MIWLKTEAGKVELKAHSLIQQAATQNPLRAIDGVKSEALLLKYLPGVTPDDFRLLYRLKLIQPRESAVSTAPDATRPPTLPVQPQASLATDERAKQIRKLALVLSRLVSAHLGLGGMSLATAIVRAESLEELQQFTAIVFARIEARAGKGAATDAAKELRDLMGTTGADSLG